MIAVLALGLQGNLLPTIRLHVRCPVERLLEIAQTVKENTYTRAFTLQTPSGRRLAHFVTGGDPTTEIAPMTSKRNRTLIVTLTAGNHAGAQVIEVARDRIHSVWEESSAGGIILRDFGSSAEILVSRRAPQVGIRPMPPEKSTEFQEVYLIRNSTIRFIGVRKWRNSLRRTSARELIPGAVAD